LRKLLSKLDRAVRDYLDGSSWQLVGESTEVESGRPERPVPATEKSPDREAGARLRWMPEAASLPGTSKTI
jgi:hypothetical protein